jgi:hypothetical protein
LVTVDTLEELETAKEVTAEDGKVTLRLDLPMPSVSAIMLTPRPD